MTQFRRGQVLVSGIEKGISWGDSREKLSMTEWSQRGIGGRNVDSTRILGDFRSFSGGKNYCAWGFIRDLLGIFKQKWQEMDEKGEDFRQGGCAERVHRPLASAADGLCGLWLEIFCGFCVHLSARWEGGGSFVHWPHRDFFASRGRMNSALQDGRPSAKLPSLPQTFVSFCAKKEFLQKQTKGDQ